MKNTSEVWQSWEGLCVLLQHIFISKKSKERSWEKQNTHTSGCGVLLISKYHSVVEVCVSDPRRLAMQTDSRTFHMKLNPTSTAQSRKITGLCLLRPIRCVDGEVFSQSSGRGDAGWVAVSGVGGAKAWWGLPGCPWAGSCCPGRSWRACRRAASAERTSGLHLRNLRGGRVRGSGSGRGGKTETVQFQRGAAASRMEDFHHIYADLNHRSSHWQMQSTNDLFDRCKRHLSERNSSSAS